MVTVVSMIGIWMAEVYLSMLWDLDGRGFSELSHRLPYWDFTNLWAGSRLAIDGHVAVLFDADAYRAALRGMFSPDLPNQEWSYPPNILLLGVPLATLPILPAYLVWTFGTVLCLWLAIRPLKLGALVELAVVLATGLFFGFDVWRLFLTETRPLMTAIMEAPYPQPYQYNAITVFFTARALGFGLTAAYGAQAVATIISIAIAVWLWRPGRQVSHQERVALTAVLAILATPYGYTYDTISLAVAVAMLAAMTSRPPRLILAICWLWPFVTHYFTWGGYCVAVLVPLFLAAWMLSTIWTGSRKAEISAKPSLA
ncbi:MAG: hypothetical protein E5W35_16775 [Mesorhizobium sp.]|nr:MAG: hypothetical protein E5W35_16775 [Mesorhizobium sp.]